MIKAMDACGVNCASNSEVITADKHKKLKASDFSPCHFLVERRKMSEPFSLLYNSTLFELFLNRFLDDDVRWKILSLNPNGLSIKCNKLLLGTSHHMAERDWALVWVRMLALLLTSCRALGELLKPPRASFISAEKMGKLSTR